MSEVYNPSGQALWPTTVNYFVQTTETNVVETKILNQLIRSQYWDLPRTHVSKCTKAGTVPVRTHTMSGHISRSK